MLTQEKFDNKCNNPSSHLTCENYDLSSQGWDYEIWKCQICGYWYKLYYEDMA